MFRQNILFAALLFSCMSQASTSRTFFVAPEEGDSSLLPEGLGDVSIGTEGTENSLNDRAKYFKNLDTYSPVNFKGSCGYVSLVQYLSYYDSFYNDSIIPEKYERNQGEVDSVSKARADSPGVLGKDYLSEGGTPYEVVQKHKSTDFQFYLIDMNAGITGKSSDDEKYTSAHMKTYDSLLKTLTSNNEVSFSYVNATSFGYSRGQERNDNVAKCFYTYVTNHLDNDEPVILHIKWIEDNGSLAYHSVVAYYADGAGIHCNFGYGSYYTDTILNESEYWITEAGVADFSSLGEKHSNNFPVKTGYYCGCGNLHTHVYDQWAYSDGKEHIEACSCGKRGTLTEEHTMGSKNKKKCSKCGGLISSFGYIEDIV